MKFRFYVVDFKKLDLKGITRFCSKFDCSVKMSIKMDSNGIGIKIFDEKAKSSISISDVHQLTAQDKESVFGNEYDNEDLIENIYLKCDHEFLIDADTKDEVRLAYLFAMYIASCTETILINLSTQQTLITTDLKKIDDIMLNKYVEQYVIGCKYCNDIKKWSCVQTKAFKISTLFWIGLIILAVVAVCLLCAMIFVYDVTNLWILSSPFIVIGCFLGMWLAFNACSLHISNKKLNNLYFDYESEMCKLFDERLPKKPSGKIIGLKNKIINILGILIIPTLIIGSILFVFEYILYGLIVILFPWVSLVLIKVLITDVNDEKLYRDLYFWLEECFNQKLPNQIVAANFDLHDLGNNNWKIEFVWCDKFDEKNSMWTKHNACLEGRKTFNFKYFACWEEVQYTTINMIKRYLENKDRTINIRLYKALTVGFNDGSVFLIYMNGKIVN